MSRIGFVRVLVVVAACASSAAHALSPTALNPIGPIPGITPASAGAGAPGQAGNGNSASAFAPGQSTGTSAAAAPGQSASPANTLAPGQLKRAVLATTATPVATTTIVPAVASVPAASVAAPPAPQFYMNGSISGNTLTVTAIASKTIRIGTVLSGPGIPPGTTVVGFGTGSGGAGTYLIKTGP